jgi:hypothetical protein
MKMQYIYNGGVLLSLKEEWNYVVYRKMEDIILCEVSQVQKNKGRMFSLICGRQIQR